MKKRRGWILVCFASLAVFAHSADPAVTNVRAAQRPGTGLVDITYDLADVDTGMLSVSLSVSTNGGFTYFSPTSTVSGDVQGVACGTDRTMVWNAAVELSPKLYANMRARVRVADIEAPPMPLPLDMPLPLGLGRGTEDRHADAGLLHRRLRGDPKTVGAGHGDEPQ